MIGVAHIKYALLLLNVFRMKDGKVPTPTDITFKLMKIGNKRLEHMVRRFLYQCNTRTNLSLCNGSAGKVHSEFIEESLASWD